MRIIRFVVGVAAVALAFFTANINAQSFDYSSTVGSEIVFPGDTTFHFSPGTDNFRVTSGTATGLFGDITGIFTIGTITIINGVSTAPVTGTGGFVSRLPDCAAAFAVRATMIKIRGISFLMSISEATKRNFLTECYSNEVAVQK